MKRVLVAIAVFVIATAPVRSDEIQLPDMGATSSSRLSPEEERQLGEAFMRRVRQNLDLVQDPQIEQYVWNLGYYLVANSDYRTRPFHFFVVKDPSINAFAGPAGHIGVHTGLILTTESESELAAVMAHEIAHVGQHHLDRAITAAEKMSLPTAGALLAAIILGAKDANLAEAAIAATLAANIQTQLNFTRAHEMEADHIGIRILSEAGFDPRAMATFFERLQQNDRLYDNEVPEFLRTHPVTTTRIAESRSRAENYTSDETRDSTLYYLMRARTRVLTHDNPYELIRSYQAQLQDGRYKNRLAVRYGYALSLSKGGRQDDARKQLKTLIKEDRERIPYVIALAEVEIAAGNLDHALDIFADGLRLNPRNMPLTRHYAQALLLARKPGRAKELLEQYTRHATPAPADYQLLAKASRQAGLTGEAYRALAEYHYLLGDTQTAITYLNRALKQEDINERESRVIKARLKELQEVSMLQQDTAENRRQITPKEKARTLQAPGAPAS